MRSFRLVLFVEGVSFVEHKCFICCLSFVDFPNRCRGQQGHDHHGHVDGQGHHGNGDGRNGHVQRLMLVGTATATTATSAAGTDSTATGDPKKGK